MIGQEGLRTARMVRIRALLPTRQVANIRFVEKTAWKSFTDVLG